MREHVSEGWYCGGGYFSAAQERDAFLTLNKQGLDVIGTIFYSF